MALISRIYPRTWAGNRRGTPLVDGEDRADDRREAEALVFMAPRLPTEAMHFDDL
jgi:hypothetical protein